MDIFFESESQFFPKELPVYNIESCSYGENETFMKQITPLSQPWKCPVCLKNFQWDTQLRRHEEKENHLNQDRNRRRARKYQVGQVKQCEFCQVSGFGSAKKRSGHMKYCLKNPKNEKVIEKHASKETGQGEKIYFECSDHKKAKVFPSLKQLIEHLAHDRERSKFQQNQRENHKTHLNFFQKDQMRKQFSKIKKLTKYEVNRISHSLKTSITSVRRYYRAFKQENNEINGL